MKKIFKQIYKKILNIVFLIIFTALLVLPAVYTNSLFGYLPILVEISLLFRDILVDYEKESLC